MTISKEELESWLAEPRQRKTVSIATREFVIQAMNEDDGASYEIALQVNGKSDFQRARREMLSIMLVDDSGTRLTKNGDALKAMPLGVANYLWEQCLEMNRYSEKEIKQLVKNSEGVEGSDLPIDSLTNGES